MIAGLRTVWYALGTCLFFVGTLVAVVVLGTAILPLAPFWPLERRAPLLVQFPLFALYWLRLCCGVKFQVLGRENLPADAALVCSRHESPWETFFLTTLRHPRTTISIAKRELLYIPFFGWGALLAGHILIRRKRGRASLKKILRVGGQHLRQGHDLIIYPEGTRSRNRKLGAFKNGAARLALQESVAMVPVVHNSADCWPANSWIKRPGMITVLIGQPIQADPALSPQQLIAKLRQAMSEMMTQLPSQSQTAAIDN